MRTALPVINSIHVSIMQIKVTAELNHVVDNNFMTIRVTHDVPLALLLGYVVSHRDIVKVLRFVIQLVTIHVVNSFVCRVQANKPEL